MPKKIKKRSKRKEEEEELLDAEGEAEGLEDGEDPFGEDDFDPEGFGDYIVEGPEAERDAFQKASFDAANWVEKNIKLVGGIAAAAILIPVAGYFGYQAMEAQKTSASAELNPAFSAFKAPIEGSPEYVAINANENLKMPTKVYGDSTQKWTAVYDAAGQARSKQPDQLKTSSDLTQAAAALKLEKWDEAITLYSGLVGSAQVKDLKPFAQFGLAQAYAGKGDVEQAAKTLDELASVDGFAGTALYHKGRTYEKAGNAEMAKAAYHRLIETQPTSTYKLDAERRLASL